MLTFTIVFLTALALSTATQTWLAWRHARHVAAHAAAVPSQFDGRISQAAHGRAARYTVARTRLGMLDLVVGVAATLAWTLGGGVQALDELWRATSSSSLLIGTGLVMSVAVIGMLINLPLELAAVFGVEQRHGFNRTTVRTFATDTVKKFALALLIGTPLVAVIIWLMDSAGSLWWLAAWVVWLGFNLIAVWAFPVLIAPLFNRFTPLEDEALAARIRRLLERHGFSSSGIFVADGSKRSGHGNAYFTGLGASKRIVFYDTLLADLDPDEVEAVLAHEVGHFKRRHIPKQLGASAAIVMAALALLAWLTQQSWFYAGLGVATPSTGAALALFMLAMPAFFFFLGPLMTALSRKHEYEADSFAASNSDAHALVSALVKLYRSNAATLTPDPLYSAFHDSHPPAPLRIAHLEQAQAGQVAT